MAGQEIKAGRAVVEVSLRDRVGKGLVAIERKLASTGRNIATLGAALSAGGLAAVAWPLKLAANMEQVAVSFEVMTGSAAKGQALLEDLKKFAANTPFNFTEVSEAGQLLLNYGISAKNVIPYLQLLGDVSNGNAMRMHLLTLALGQVISRGKLTGDNLKQLTESGFNPLQQMAQDLAKQLGGIADNYMPQLQTAMENGQISVAQVTKAFISATSAGGRWFQSMQRQSQTGLGLFNKMLELVTYRAIDFGMVVLDSLKPAMEKGIILFEAMGEVIKKNAGVLKIFGGVAAGLIIVGGLLAAVGLGALALSSIVGGLAMAWGFVVGAIGALFTPMGAVVALLALAAVVAWNFRGAITSALSGVAEYFAPLGAAIYSVYEIFATTFGGILAALAGGQLQEAAGIAWLGFVAAAWQAIADLSMAIDAGITYLQSWIPGVEGVKNYVTSAFASMGQAILAGRWDLAAAIMMAKARLAISIGWNAIANTWTGFAVLLGSAWDTIVSGIQTTWRTAVNEIAKWLVWLAEQAGVSMDGVKAELDRMNAADQKRADKAQAGREQGRYNGGADAIAKREQDAQALRNQIAELEKQSSQAYTAAGAPTIADAAGNARKQLDEAMKTAEDERKAAEKGGDKFKPNLPSLAASAGQQMKVESKGTFSAAAATLFGLGGNDAPQQQTAANTRRMAIGITQLNDKLGAGATV